MGLKLPHAPALPQLTVQPTPAVSLVTAVIGVWALVASDAGGAGLRLTEMTGGVVVVLLELLHAVSRAISAKAAQQKNRLADLHRAPPLGSAWAAALVFTMRCTCGKTRNPLALRTMMVRPPTLI